MATPMRPVNAEDDVELDACDLLLRGFVREALQQLLRRMPEELRHHTAGARASAQESGAMSFQVALCYALLGMDRDAADWCTHAERDAGLAGDRDARLAQIRCLRLWLAVFHGALTDVIEATENLFASRGLSPDVKALGIGALIMLALKSDLPRVARRLMVAGREGLAKDTLGAAVLELCAADISFRDLIASLSPFAGAAGRPDNSETDADTMYRCTQFAQQLEFMDARLRAWPLLRELAATLRISVRVLIAQMQGQRRRMADLELRVGALGNRGLTTMHRHMRFLLAFLHYHQARNATAESWLCDGMSLARWSETADAKELLMVANGRAESHDWQTAFLVYRAYVRSAAARTEVLQTLVNLVHQNSGAAIEFPIASGTFGVPDASMLTSAARNDGHSAAGPQVLSSRRVSDCKRTALAVRELVESDLTRPLLVSDIAARLGIARRTIENRVRIECGTSVKRFVTELRLRHAYRLVLDRGPVDAHVLQSIAIQVGFSSYRAFCAAYTRSYGRIPHRRGRPRNDGWS